MSDSNSINPVGLASTVAGGAVAGALAPKVYALGKKYAPAVKANVDSVVLSTKNVATQAGAKVADLSSVTGTKIKNVATSAFSTVSEYASKGFNAVKKMIPAKVADFVSKATTNVAKIVKKPMVAAALIAGLAYGIVSKLNQNG